jgi:hypothetical protein
MSGLDILGIAASIIQVADTGLGLSKHIYSYVGSIASADKRLDQLATDVRLTSQIVRDVGNLFSGADAAVLVAETGINNAKECIGECEAAFKDIELFVDKSKSVSLLC